jgi:hypothetical protein
MKTYETSATVQEDGAIRVAGVPFPPGTEVEVTIGPKRPSGEQFAEAWKRVSAQLRGAPSQQNLTDETIENEIQDFRGH